jgi:hypothetical protein
VDISGWILKDDDDTRTDAIPAGTTLAPGAFYVFTAPAMSFGLGKADAARLFRPDGTTLVDSYVDGSRHGDLRAVPGRRRWVLADHDGDAGRDQCLRRGDPDPTPTLADERGAAVRRRGRERGRVQRR